MCFANKKWQPMISGFLVRTLCMWENALEFLIKTFGLCWVWADRRVGYLLSLIDLQFLRIIHAGIIKVLLCWKIMFVFCANLACVCSPSNSEGKIPQKKVKQGAVLVSPGQKKIQSWATAIVIRQKCSSLSAIQMQQPEFVLTAGF